VQADDVVLLFHFHSGRDRTVSMIPAASKDMRETRIQCMIADMELAEPHTRPIVKLPVWNSIFPLHPRLTDSRLAAFDMSLPIVN
jgi:hypothetical protein